MIGVAVTKHVAARLARLLVLVLDGCHGTHDVTAGSEPDASSQTAQSHRQHGRGRALQMGPARVSGVKSLPRHGGVGCWCCCLTTFMACQVGIPNNMGFLQRSFFPPLRSIRCLSLPLSFDRCSRTLYGDAWVDMCDIACHPPRPPSSMSWQAVLVCSSSCKWVPRDSSVSSGRQGPKWDPSLRLRL